MGNRIVRVIDGDTLEVRNWLCRTMRLRLARVDCPELKPPINGTPHRELHVQAANVAKHAMMQRALGKRAEITLLKKDRYDRYIAEVVVSTPKIWPPCGCRSCNLSDWLLENKLAKPWAKNQTKREQWSLDELREVLKFSS